MLRSVRANEEKWAQKYILVTSSMPQNAKKQRSRPGAVTDQKNMTKKKGDAIQASKRAIITPCRHMKE